MAESNEPKKVLGGSLFLKLLVLLGIAIIVWTIWTSGDFSIVNIFWNVAKIGLGFAIILFVVWGIMSRFQEKPFSPTESHQKKLKRIAKVTKPFNVRELYLRGEGMRVHSKLGHIEGLTFIPYVTSLPMKDNEGNTIFTEKRNLKGEIVKGEDGKPEMIPKMQLIESDDGDWCFMVRKGNKLFGDDFVIRAHPDFCSDLGERTWINTRGLINVGDFWYPSEQYQRDLTRIQSQHKSETLVETYEHFLDLVANVTQMSLGGDPTYQKILQTQAETLSNRNAGMLVRE